MLLRILLLKNLFLCFNWRQVGKFTCYSCSKMFYNRFNNHFSLNKENKLKKKSEKMEKREKKYGSREETSSL